MTDLATWLEHHTASLIVVASEALSHDTVLQSQVAQSVEVFYDALLRSARAYDPTPLYTVLFDWVNARSAPMDEDPSSLVPVLAQLKAITGDQIYRWAEADAATLYYAADSIFTDALVFLSAIEAEDLLITARGQLERAEREIAHINRSKTDFVSIAAHELKTPLTVIEGYSGILRQISAAEQDSSLGVLADGIDNGARRLREIVEDLVDVSVIDLQLLELNLQPVFLPHIVDAAERSVREFVSQRRQRLIIEREVIPTGPLLADPERLLQALNKLLVNAIKYTPDGGTITLHIRESGYQLEFSVADTGIGLTPDEQRMLGTKFWRADNDFICSQPGSGLGIAITRGLIEQMGGELQIESAAGHGSTFTFAIPIRSA